MPDDRPTVPDATTTIELPLSGPRARQLAEALNDYAKVCIAVKKALETVHEDGGRAYQDARDAKHAHFNMALSTFDSVLAYIAVHARDPG